MLGQVLYLQAWVYPKKPEIQITIDQITQHSDFLKHDTFEPLSYELRALALAAWRTNNNHLKILLSNYSEEIKKELTMNTGGDKGPAAMTFFFSYLAGIDDYQNHDDLQNAMGALNDGSYWFELALLLKLCGQTKDAHRYMRKYQLMRQDCCEKLSQFWSEKNLKVAMEIAKREQQENKLMNELNEEYMLDNGLIPL